MYTQKKPIENVHIVRERDRQRFRELLAVVTLGLPIGLFLLLFTWQNLEVIRLGHEATRLQKQKKELEDTNSALRLELDRQTSLATVEEKARALGFEPTPAASIVMVSTPDKPQHELPPPPPQSGAPVSSAAEPEGAGPHAERASVLWPKLPGFGSVMASTADAGARR